MGFQSNTTFTYTKLTVTHKTKQQKDKVDIYRECKDIFFKKHPIPEYESAYL